MPYEYLDHTADLGIRAVGNTLQEAFHQGATAMFSAIADIQPLAPQLACPVTCSAPDVAALFVEWLNELLYQAEVRNALWQSAHVTHLEQTESGWTLEGLALGEPLALDRHTLHTEVKAATYAGLAYRQTEDKHILECVLDL